MKLENIDLVDDTIMEIREHEALLERLEKRVFSIILTDGTQKTNRDADDEHQKFVITTIYPDENKEGHITSRLGALFVYKLKEAVAEEIEQLKQRLIDL